MTQMIDSQRPINTAAAPRFELGFADTVEAIRATQMLRYQIFAGELGAQIDGDGVDVDHFDAYCKHLTVHDTHTGQLIACTRLLTCDQAQRAGGPDDPAGWRRPRDARVAEGGARALYQAADASPVRMPSGSIRVIGVSLRSTIDTLF